MMAGDRKGARARRNGGRLLVDALKAHGADTIFSVAGESFIEVLDALYDSPEIRLVTCRHESGAAFMAEATAKLTGRPGLAIVTRGPGASNAAIGVHTARQDSTPMILFVGQVGRAHLGREAFQEVDYRLMFAPLAKWVEQIEDAGRIPEIVARAWQIAVSGRPGPVVLALPEDMLRDESDAPDVAPTATPQATTSMPDFAQAIELLARAERPLLIVGGGGWEDDACDAARKFAEAWRLPVACAFRRQDLIDNRSPAYVGDLGTGPNPKLVARVRDADAILAIGTRLDEMTTQAYASIESPSPRQTLIHVYPGAEELGRVFRPAHAILSTPAGFVHALAGLPSPPGEPRWAAWARAARGDYEESLVPPAYSGALDLGRIFVWLRERLPDNAIVVTDAGNFSGWAQRFLLYRRPGRQLGPISGAMGYGVPAAVAAALRHPGSPTVCMVGDGGFLMTGQELATAMATGAAPVVLLFNNDMYGTIRMHQERRFPGRVVGTGLVNPDFVELARSYGAFAARVARTEEFAPAFEAALAARRAAVLELRIDPDVITTRTTLSAIRAAAQAGKA